MLTRDFVRRNASAVLEGRPTSLFICALALAVILMIFYSPIDAILRASAALGPVAVVLTVTRTLGGLFRHHLLSRRIVTVGLTVVLTWWGLSAVGFSGYRMLFPAPVAHERRNISRPLQLVYPGTTSETAVIVALGGGGSRAAAFGTSILQFLHDPKYFTLSDGTTVGDRMTRLVGVSGGALAAASYVYFKGNAQRDGTLRREAFFQAQWNRITRDFELIFKTSFLPLLWPEFIVGGTSAVHALAWIWHVTGTLPRNATLRSIEEMERDPKVRIPRLELLATDMASGGEAIISSAGVTVLKPPRPEQTEASATEISAAVRVDVALAELVAASAALPGVFTPYKVKKRDGPDLSLVDGGVLDNHALKYLEYVSRRTAANVRRVRGRDGQFIETPRKVLLILVKAPGGLGFTPTGRIGTVISAFDALYNYGEPPDTRGMGTAWGWAHNQSREIGVCLGVVEFESPRYTHHIKTRWRLDPGEKMMLSLDALVDEADPEGPAFDREGPALRIREFLDWNGDEAFLTPLHVVGDGSAVHAAERKPPSGQSWQRHEGSWVGSLRDTCSRARFPAGLEDFARTSEGLARRLIPVKEVKNLTVFRDVGGAGLRLTVITKTGRETLFSVSVDLAGAIEIFCDGAGRRELEVPRRIADISGNNGGRRVTFEAVAERIRAVVGDPALMNLARRETQYCLRGVFPEWVSPD